MVSKERVETVGGNEADVRAADRRKQMEQAEELLAGPQPMGVAESLFFGRFLGERIMPYPELPEEEWERAEEAVTEVRRVIEQSLDAEAIDRAADIPRELIEALGRVGVMGMTAPAEHGGRELSQMGYCRVMEQIGGACASTSVFVNAHHSIGMRALLLFGTDEQKRKWLGPLVRGEKLAAFALTEPKAGSDAASVQTTATPSADGSHFILNGEKRYITNGSTADVLTVMARTPIAGSSETAVTAFLVTPDMPGFSVTEARMEKLGIRGTVTSRLAFHDMAVPAENVLGSVGKGLKVALTVLDFGRTTFGACCTGAAKTALRLAAAHAKGRRQFGRALSEFELVRKKIAHAAAFIYAMEAMTRVTASLIDRGQENYMLETAMLKVFSTEALWTIVNDAFQIHGGAAYFTDRPLERMLRDARINQIGEGANEVLLSFIALVGMRGPGQELQKLWEALHHPWSQRGRLWRLGWGRTMGTMRTPDVAVRSPSLRPAAQRLAKLIHRFGRAVQSALIHHREAVIDRQYLQERIAQAGIELFASACVLSRLDASIQEAGGNGAAPNQQAAQLFLRCSARRVKRWLAELEDHDDAAVTAAAKEALEETATVNDER